ncbi:hypothetical protein KCV87_14730 [Actinosynnema pretiosum subsp. pretiosum]|uniref:Uncharacterized protein n=1 Tax=Actinosynnema pretiosum subsp. pretiosum TaxID=103721 RepID=A0AA45LCR8_9PSEU|nr:hypothetical protein KCV87_14730 [Actinosynnema pretiosum subsp. pretiosum]
MNELSGTGGNVQGFEDHPDLNSDEPWVRQALARSKRERRRARLRSRGAKAGYAALALAVAAGAAFWLRGADLPGGAARVGAAATGSTAATTTTEATAVSTVDDWRRVDPADPFAGTPAATWADGAAGVTVPQAAPVGPHGAEEVAAAYERARQLVVAARLDRRTLVDHDPEPLLSLLAPDSHPQVRDSLAASSGSSLVTRVARGFALLPVEPKVTGSMSAGLDPEGNLLVTTDYLFAYAFAFGDRDRVFNPMQTVVVTRMRTEYSLVSGNRYAPGSQGAWFTSSEGYTYSMACGPAREGLIAPAYSEQALETAPSTTAPPERYFDPSMPIALEGDGCER